MALDSADRGRLLRSEAVAGCAAAMPLLRSLLLLPALLRLCSASLPREISINIPEEQEIGHEVTIIAPEDQRQSVYVGEKKLQIDYQFFSSPATEKFFHLNSKTGRLTVHRKIDRDNICTLVSTCCPHKATSNAECVLNLSVRSDIEYNYVYLLHIKVLDVNDNAPRWAQSELTAQFSESAAVGDYRTISTAVDADSGTYGVQRYEMEPQMAEFQLEFLRGPGAGGMTSTGNGGELRLKLQNQLDREKKATYEFTLYAVDGGEPARTGSVKVRVVVTDENDNKPIFDQKVYTGTIMENTESNAQVIKVSATDRDDGPNGQVEFHISSLTKPEVRRLFNIDPLTGLIRVQGNIDYEEDKSLKLLIEASDRGVSPRKSLATVELKVIDQNDNYPIVYLQSSTGNSPLHNNLAQIKENLPSGTLVAAFSVDDKDSGPNGKVTCQLGDSGYFGLRSMNIPDTVMYRLQTATVLDREEVSLHKVLVICEDEGSPQALTSTTTMNVRVLDQNDETPRFNPEHYFENVREDLPVGSYVFSLNASDKDEGNNGILNYWIASDKPTPFKVDKVTGKVRLQAALDRETQDRLTFVVFAHDLGDPLRRTGSATVSVSVTDANDNAPQLKPFYYFSIPENQSAGASVGFINATDRDKGPNARLTYNLVALPHTRGSSGHQYFHITPQGELLVIHSGLDRETQALHTFLVRVTDNGRPRKTSSATISITITDVNDCKPRFVFPRKSNNTLFVPHRSKSGHIIGRILAIDNDAGANQQVTYSYRQSRSNLASTLFNLDPHSGEVRLEKDLTPEDVRQYHLLVEARDAGVPVKSSIEVLKIKVMPASRDDRTEPLPPRRGQGEMMGNNLIVIIALVGVTAVFVLVLITAILVLSCKRRRHIRRPPAVPPSDDVPWDAKGTTKSLKLAPPERRWLGGQPGEMDTCPRDLTVIVPGDDGRSMASADPSSDSGKGTSLTTPSGRPGSREETVYQALSKFNAPLRNPNLNTTDDLKRSLKHQYETLVQEDEVEYDPKGTLRAPSGPGKLFDDRLSPIEEANANQQLPFNHREMDYFYDNQSTTLKKKNAYQPVIGASFV